VLAASGEMKCALASLIPFRFNLKNNRFLGAYLIGFAEGEDNPDGTAPTIFGDTCTKTD
jgi:hypothetical protein